jgi:hypothetical protein
MKTRLRPWLAIFGLLVGAMATLAHHSFQSEYDASKPASLTGVVTKVEWMNPHAHFYIDVKEANGTINNWNMELASPNVLRRLGWTREIFKAGDMVTVEGARARDGSRMANARLAVLADGRKMLAGSSADEAQGK